MLKPSIGRIVHYVSYGTPGGEYRPECRAAFVTEVHGQVPATEGDEWVVGLAVMNPTGMFFNREVVQMENGREGGSWHWPERVD